MTLTHAAPSPGTVGTTNRVGRVPWARFRSSDPMWADAGIVAILVATATLYLCGLSKNGWANSFYSAAVQAGTQSWKAAFFGSSDAGNSITVDKPPASLWLMEIFTRLFGVSSVTILLPEVLLGLATVFVLYRTVRRYFGPGAGLIAAGIMALTPVAVLMFRFNNPDALLVFLMTSAAWATLRAIESARHPVRWFSLAGAILGLAFLTKTLQSFLPIPFFGIAFLVCAAAPLRKRLVAAFCGVVALVAAGGWWVAIVELMPADARPYIGGSQNNSFLELTFGYNGFGRISGNEVGSVGGGGMGPGGAPGGGMWGETGFGRLFNAEVGGQISWLIPAAVILLVAGLWLRGRAPRTDMRRAAMIVWGGWLVVTFATFSFMAGIFHPYYTVALAPAIAAVVAMGAAEAWQRRTQLLPRVVLAAAMLATGIWAFVLLSRSAYYDDALRITALSAGIVGAIGLLVAHRITRRFLGVVIFAAVISAAAGPAAYAATTVNTPTTGSIVFAGPSTGGPGGMQGHGGMGFPGGMQPPNGAVPPNGMQPPNGGGFPGGMQGGLSRMPGTTGATELNGRGGMGGFLDAAAPDPAVVAALSDHADEYTWVAAAVGSQSAAGLQLATGHAVMPIGGFNGSDPSPTLQQFQQYVHDGKIHYLLVGGGPGGMGGFGATGGTAVEGSAAGGVNTNGRMGMSQHGGSRVATDIQQWVEANYTKVEIGGQTFYDLTAPTGGAGDAAN